MHFSIFITTILIFFHFHSNQLIALGRVVADVILETQHEVVLESDFQVVFHQVMQILSKIAGFFLFSFGFFFFVFGVLTLCCVTAEVDGDINGCHELGGQIFDVHFGHVPENVPHISGNVDGKFRVSLLGFANEAIFAETTAGGVERLLQRRVFETRQEGQVFFAVVLQLCCSERGLHDGWLLKL